VCQVPPSFLLSMIIAINFNVFTHRKFNCWSFSHLKFMYSLISSCDCKNNDTNIIKQFNSKKNNWLCFTVSSRRQKDVQSQLSRQLLYCTSSFPLPQVNLCELFLVLIKCRCGKTHWIIWSNHTDLAQPH
jgi:hypothetical protein